MAGQQAAVPPQNARSEGAVLRICLLSYRGNPRSGGQGIYVARLSAALADLGHEVTVLSGPPYPELDARVRLEIIPGLDLFDGRNKLTAFRLSWLRSPLALYEWLSALTGGFPEPYSYGQRAYLWLQQHRAQFDVVHDNQSLCFALLKIQDQMPLVTTIHHPITRDLEFQLRFARGFCHRLLIRRWHSFLRMQMQVAPHLQHLISPSENTCRDLATAFGVHGERVAVVPLGVDEQVFRPHKEVERQPLRVMVTTSADVPLKGLDTLLAATSLLLPRLPDLELVIIGRPRPGGHTLRRVQELGLKECVRFVAIERGAEQIAELYASATLAVVPSLYEGFGLPAVEAMCCGVPLVVTDGGALPEVVGDAGLVVPVEDPEAMATKMEQVLSDMDLQQKLGQAGRARAAARYRWEHTARATEQQYRVARVAWQEQHRADG